MSWLCEMGMMPARLTRPTVGLTPTIPLADEGHTIEPSVSVPIATAVRFAATAAPDPELDPHGLRSSTYGFRHCPPRALHPLEDRVERMFAHSLRFAFPSRMAPASRSRRADERILRGHRSHQRQRTGRRRHSIRGVDVVFQQDGNAVQRAADLPLLPFAIELIRNRRRLRIDFDDGAKRRSLSIETVDAAQVRVHDRAGGEAAGPHPSLQIRDRQFVELEGWGDVAAGAAGSCRVQAAPLAAAMPARALVRRKSRRCMRR